MASCPAIDWRSYFQGLSGWRQDDFEQALAARGVSLGEYMEIIEHAAMDACAGAVLRDADAYSANDILPLASRLLSRYVRRKAELVARLTLRREGTARDILAKSRLEGRASIHRRVEEIEAGLHRP